MFAGDRTRKRGRKEQRKKINPRSRSCFSTFSHGIMLISSLIDRWCSTNESMIFCGSPSPPFIFRPGKRRKNGSAETLHTWRPHDIPLHKPPAMPATTTHKYVVIHNKPSEPNFASTVRYSWRVKLLNQLRKPRCQWPQVLKLIVSYRYPLNFKGIFSVLTFYNPISTLWELIGLSGLIRVRDRHHSGRANPSFLPAPPLFPN